MESETPIEKMTKLPEVDAQDSDDRISEGATQVIYIEPEKELAARRKFDKFLVPVSLVFIVLSALDRNNVSGPFFFCSLPLSVLEHQLGKNHA